MTNAFISKDFLIEVNKGNVAGHELIHKFGFSNQISATHRQVWNAPTAVDLVWQTVAAEYDVYSSLAADDGNPPGIGAHKVVLECIDANFNAVTETVVLNGTTPVTTTQGPYIRCNRALVEEVGAYNGENEGAIRVEVTSGGLKTGDLQAYIEANEGTTQKTQHTIPAGKTAFILRVSLTIDSNKITKIEMHSREGADVFVSPFGATRVKHQWDGMVAPLQEEFNANHIIPSKSDVWFGAEVNAGSGSILEIDYDILLVDNNLLNL